MKTNERASFLAVTALLTLTCVTSAPANGLPETANAMAVLPGTPGKLIAGTSSGLFINEDGSWKNIGLQDINITDIAMDYSEPAMVYAVSNEGGLFKGKLSGSRYENLVVTADGNEYSARAITVFTAEPSVILVATRDGYLLQSRDAGSTWNIMNPEFPLTVINSVSIYPEDTDTIYVGTGGNGILKSTDAGKSWESINEGLTDLTITRLSIDQADPSRMYAGTYGGGVFMSTNGGSSWMEVNDGLENTFVYSLTLEPSIDGNKGSLFDMFGQKKGSTGIFVGVFGGGIYRSELPGKPEWKSL